MNVGESYNPKGLFTGIFIPETMAKIPNEMLCSGAKLCFGRLCWHVNENGECFPSRETLASEIGVSESSVRDYLKQLEDQGFIRRIRNGPHVNDYEFSWTDVLEASIKRKDRQRAVYQKNLQTDSGLSKDRQRAVEPNLIDIREELREEINTPPTPSEENSCTRSDFLRLWNGTRGLKHLGVGDRAKVIEIYNPIPAPQSDVATALGNFSQWLPIATVRTRPVEIFLRDPLSWLTYRTVEKPEQLNVTGMMDVPIESAIQRDYPAEWNRLVPAAAMEWHPSLSPMAALQKCADNEVFRERFDEVCAISQKIHEARGADASWLTLPWVLKEKRGEGFGWWKVLTSLKGMAEKSGPKTKFEQNLEYTHQAMQVIDQQQTRLRAERTRTR